MIYLWKLFMEWAAAYPESAFAADVCLVIGFIVIIIVAVVVNSMEAQANEIDPIFSGVVDKER